MTRGEREIQRMITAAFRDAASNGHFTCASELFGYDPEENLSERYLLDATSVPMNGPVSITIYNLEEREAWEVEVTFSVRDVSAQPYYERLFATHQDQWEIDHAI